MTRRPRKPPRPPTARGALDELDEETFWLLARSDERQRAIDKPGPAEPERRRSGVGVGQYGVVRMRGKSWRFQFRGERGPDGKRKQRSIRIGPVTALSYDQARAVADRVLEQLMPRRIPAGSACTWEDWCRRFNAVYVPSLRGSSGEVVASVVRKQLHSAFAGLHLHEIRIARVQTWIASMIRKGDAANSIRHRFQVLRRMLGRARAEGLAVEVPTTRDVDLPRSDDVEERSARAFTTDELQRILATSEEPWRTLWMLCAFCGLRIGEALGLRWTDVDLDAGRLSIVRQAARGRETRTKTRASIADRKIPPGLLEHLRGWAASPDPAGFLFPSPRRAGPYHASGVRRHHLHPILERLRITGRSSHGFRHWFGTEGARAGVLPPMLQRALRHSDHRSTERYIGISTADVDAAIVAIESRYLLPEKAGNTPAEASDAPTSS